MTQEGKVKVALRGVELSVPILKDEETTLRLVDAVNRRLRSIEAGARKVDTQKFALLAAYLFAMDAEETKLEAAEQEEQLLAKLDQLFTKVQEMLKPTEEEPPEGPKLRVR